MGWGQRGTSFFLTVSNSSGSLPSATPAPQMETNRFEAAVPALINKRDRGRGGLFTCVKLFDEHGDGLIVVTPGVEVGDDLIVAQLRVVDAEGPNPLDR